MSTRAHIRIKDGLSVVQLYHHHDGYPEGVGVNLKEFLAKKYPDEQYYWDGCDIANALIKGAIEYEHRNFYTGKTEIVKDLGYEITTCIHGDEEYVYVIDCDRKTLKCYSHDWDETFEATCKPENERQIP